MREASSVGSTGVALQHYKLVSMVFSQAVDLNGEQIEILEKNRYNYIAIKDGVWQQLNLQKVFPFITECKHDNALIICNNFILHVRFPKLKKLTLNDNNIETIDNICLFYFPCLERLNLKNNRIISIKPLRRASMPNLLVLGLWGNEIAELGWLSELANTRLSELELESDRDQGMFQDFRPAVKLQSMDVTEVDLRGRDRIMQRKTYSLMYHRRRSTMESPDKNHPKDIVQTYDENEQQ